MSSRQNKLGIKQVIRLEWMNKITSLLLAGIDEKLIRKELHDIISQDENKTTSENTRSFIVYNLMNAWGKPNNELFDFRNDALKLARELPPKKWLPLHWAVISAAYPFWFNVAKQVGRLLNLQEKITQKQIFNRLKEQYGDRETVARNARYTVRSFVAWNVLKDSDIKGCYERGQNILVSDYKEIMALLESGLLAEKEGKMPLDVLLNSPGFFPFRLSTVTGDFIAQNSSRINVVRYSLDDNLLELKNKI